VKGTGFYQSSDPNQRTWSDPADGLAGAQAWRTFDKRGPRASGMGQTRAHGGGCALPNRARQLGLRRGAQHWCAGPGPTGQWPREGKERRARVRLLGGPRLLGLSSTPSRAHGRPCLTVGGLFPGHASCSHRVGVTGQHGRDEWMKKGGERTRLIMFFRAK
jgi:hypothetical protein